MIIKLGSQLPLALTLFSLWLQFSFPLCETRQLHIDRIVFPDEFKTKMMETRNSSSAVNINETKFQELQRKLTEDIDGRIRDFDEQTTKEAQENSTEQSRNKTSESPKITDGNTMVPNKVEFGPRITLDTLPICGEGLKLSGSHCRKEA